MYLKKKKIYCKYYENILYKIIVLIYLHKAPINENHCHALKFYLSFFSIIFSPSDSQAV